VDAAFRLRAIEPSDDEFLYRLYASTREVELRPVPWSPEQKAAFLRMQFEAQAREWGTQNPNGSFQVVLVDGERAGRLYVDERPDEFRVVDISLLPAFRGRGIGTALLNGVIRTADAAGKPVRIHVERFNPAQGLYRRLGFRVIREGDVYLFMERPVSAGGSGA
jgi:ribosomal protein S18 acetylase RimI-like enzyme